MTTFGKNALATAVLLFVWLLGARLYRPDLTDYIVASLLVNVVVFAAVNYDTATERASFSKSMSALLWGFGMSALLYGVAILLMLITILFSSLMPTG